MRRGRGAYTWSIADFEEKVGLSAGGFYAGGGIGGEIRYLKISFGRTSPSCKCLCSSSLPFHCSVLQIKQHTNNGVLR